MKSEATISKETHRRFILGKQGLWPGRRWAGKAGVASAMRAAEALQVDPVSVVAQSHEIVLWGRVADFQPEYMHQLAYEERRFFDYGGHLDIYPMEDLPFWRPLMERRRSQERWKVFADDNRWLVEKVRRTISDQGPVRSRDLDGTKVEHYRAGKDTGVVLYFLWLVGELMTHRREGRERVYDLLERIAPEELRHSVSESEAVDRFIRKGIAQRSLVDRRELRAIVRGLTEPRIPDDEADRRFDELLESGELVPVTTEGSKSSTYAAAEDLSLLKELSAGGVPKGWDVHGPTTEEEAVFLSPLEYVSARGRAKKLFDFDYTWEIYRPDHLRRYGPYTLPVLYGDRLVARIDMRLDRTNRALIVNGLWIEAWFEANGAFAGALTRGLLRFASFLGATSFDGIETLSGLPKEVARAIRALPR